MKRTEFPNLGVVAVLLRAYCAPIISILENEYPTPEDKLEAVRIMATDEGNEEISDICDYIENKGLIRTFFPD